MVGTKRRSRMKSMIVLLLAALSLSTYAAEDQCELEGAGYVYLHCENGTERILVTANGTDAGSMHEIKVYADGETFESNPEKDLPADVFERVDEGVFTLKN